jgi:murein DD-endopeptidase MepM/ murein hydrolase activator NlpD
MNLKWTKKKLTVVVIPDVHGAVVRLRIPNFLPYTAAAILIALISISLTMSYLHRHSLIAASELKSELALINNERNETVSSKEQAIKELQNEVITLAKQAEQMKTKVAEMKTFESDLKSIAQIDSSAQGGKEKSVPKDASPSAAAIGEGGSMIPVTQDEILKLGQQTEADMVSLSNEIEVLRSNLTLTKQKVEEKQSLLRGTPTIWPTTTKTITSSFGYRRDPFTQNPSFHSGIDFGASENDPVYAAADGNIITTGSDSAHGNNIVIQHPGGIRTWYMHLNKINVHVGDTVSKGQTIGLVGSTGRSTGPHLHYEVIKNGTSIDPTPYLQTLRKDGQ